MSFFIASCATNWDQGSLSLWELEKLLAVILQKEQVVGIDICGECSTTLNLFSLHRVQQAQFFEQLFSKS